MREYVRPGFENQQRQREVEKLEAILQALKNSYRALGTVNGGEDADLARQDIYNAYQAVDRLRQYKAKALPAATPNARVLDVELEEDGLDD